MSKGRHPKKAIADALTAVARPGLDVVEIHRGHRWGVLAPSCGAEPSLWSTTSKNIHRFDLRHRHGEER